MVRNDRTIASHVNVDVASLCSVCPSVEYAGENLWIKRLDLQYRIVRILYSVVIEWLHLG